MLILSKYSIDKKKYFLPCFTKRLCDFKKYAIFKNTIFKIALIEIALPNGPKNAVKRFGKIIVLPSSAND
jgi:hypothetical protein